MLALSTTIKNIQDIMRKDAGVDGDAQRISQLSWLIFLKILDDHEQEYEQLESNYQSPIPDRFRWHNWAPALMGLTGNELLNFINNELFKCLKELATTMPAHPLSKVISSVFEDSYNYMRSGYLIRQVIDKL